MRRQDLEHLLRAACQIVGDPDVLIIGSQAILAEIPEERLPPEATRSAEADLAFLNEDGTKWAKVDGAIGEMSQFDATFGYYAQGVEVSTAILPAGWRDRLIRWETPNTAPGRGWLLERHDCVASKLAAGRRRTPSSPPRSWRRDWSRSTYWSSVSA